MANIEFVRFKKGMLQRNAYRSIGITNINSIKKNRKYHIEIVNFSNKNGFTDLIERFRCY